MTPDRWRQIEELYHRALERPSDMRGAFLAEACGGDQELKRRLELLLAEDASPDKFLDQPAANLLSEVLTGDSVASLPVGTRLGPYRIEGILGRGGMGQVYKAHDSRLGRRVAIKVSTDRFDRRFEQEARAVAALNHPNVCTLYDVGPDYLVMELVEGQTLAERIASGPLPVDEALRIALQIAAALEYSHEKGVIHRDLKPGNVKITREGSVKVLDFGLAKLPAEARGATAGDSTWTMRETQPGMILGTAAYMAPEQARGQTIDKRVDIWAFGAVLYEMLTGVRPFQRNTFTDTLAAVLHAEPAWERAPVKVQRLLRACLEKDPRQRLRDIGDATRLLEEGASFEPTSGYSLWPWAVAGMLGIALVISVLVYRHRPPAPGLPMKLNVELGPNALLTSRGGLAISPDGRRLAFRVRGADGKLRLSTRRLDQSEEVTMLAGTEGVSGLFFSPDSQWIAFFADHKLKKIGAEGGAPVTLCEAPGNLGGSWGDDGYITATLELGMRGISRIPAAGGAPSPVTVLDAEKGEMRHSWPQVLPGGHAILFSAYSIAGGLQAPNIEVLSLKNGRRKTLGAGFFARYLPTGHLVYIQNNTLFAAAFDPDRLALSGSPQPMLADITPWRTAFNASDFGGEFDFSQTGTLVCLSGNAESRRSLFWLDNTAKIQPLGPGPGIYSYPRFSPDGKHLAFAVEDGQGHEDIWLHDLERGAASRLTFLPGANEAPVWTPDSKFVVFLSQNATAPGIYSIRADRSGEAQRLTEIKIRTVPHSISPDGKHLAGFRNLPSGGLEIWTAALDGGGNHLRLGKPETSQPSPLSKLSIQRDPVFSPDGRWLAYSSNESGRDEVHVRPFPGPGGVVQISISGGEFPIWSRNTRQLFFRGADGRITVSRYTVQGDSFVASKPQAWSGQRIFTTSPPLPTYDLAPDGKRFAVILYADGAAEQKPITHVTFVVNFFDELRRRVKAGYK